MTAAVTVALPMVGRFQPGRWSETRKAIHMMSPGDTLTFTEAAYFDAKASVERLNDAYQGVRKWKLATKNKRKETTVRREL